MPFLAGPPPPPITTFPPPNLRKETRSLAFMSLDGEDLMPWSGGEYFLLAGARGLDMPPLTAVTEQIPGMDGGRLREIQVGIREVFLPLFFTSDTSHADYLSKRHTFAKMISHLGKDYASNDGSFDLVATSGANQRTRTLRCYYVSGREGSYGNDESGTYWESLGVTLNAARPYWRGDPWSTEVVRLPPSATWFPGFPGQLSPSRALGAGLDFSVDGDVPSWPTLEVVGPATSVTVTAPGLSVTIPAGVDAGEVVVISTDPRHRTATFDGVRDWTRIGPADRYAPFAPGDRRLSISVPGASQSSTARVYGDTQYAEWC